MPPVIVASCAPDPMPIFHGLLAANGHSAGSRVAAVASGSATSADVSSTGVTLGHTRVAITVLVSNASNCKRLISMFPQNKCPVRTFPFPNDF
jgi:hypothetical protein